MENSNIFQDSQMTGGQEGRKPPYTPSLVLGILSIVLGILIALIGEILCIIGIVLAAVNRQDFNTKPGMTCSIVGLAISIIIHIMGILAFIAG